MRDILAQDGCWNCRHVWHASNIDPVASYMEWGLWCHYYDDFPPEIEQGKSLSWVYEDGLTDEEAMRRYQLLSQWKKKREVEEYQKCCYWEKGKTPVMG
jgi:hypothetical protein